MRWWQVGIVGVLTIWCASSAMAGTIQGEVLIKGEDDHRDIVIYIDGLDQLADSSARVKVEVEQHRLVFMPHVTAVMVGGVVDFVNSDNMLHDIFLLDTNGTRHPFQSFGRDHTLSYTFDNPGVATLLCRRHQEMWASILVLTNPYHAVTDRDGRYVIANVPPGNYTLTAWHERWHPMSRQVVVVKGQAAEINFELGSLVSDLTP